MTETTPDADSDLPVDKSVLIENLTGYFERFYEARGDTRSLMKLIATQPLQARAQFLQIAAVHADLQKYLREVPMNIQFEYQMDGLLHQDNTAFQNAGIVHDLKNEYFGANDYQQPGEDIVETYLIPLAAYIQETGVLFRAVMAMKGGSES